MLQAKRIAQCILRIFLKAKRGLLKTYFLPLISVFTLVNSKLRNIPNDKMTAKTLIINVLSSHLSFVIFAITLSLVVFACDFKQEKFGWYGNLLQLYDENNTEAK